MLSSFYFALMGFAVEQVYATAFPKGNTSTLILLVPSLQSVFPSGVEVLFNRDCNVEYSVSAHGELPVYDTAGQGR